MRELIVGSRGSALALKQTNWVIGKLLSVHPDLVCHIKIIKTKGDKILDVALAKIGDKGLFVKEIEEALIAGEIDFAVHSAKDLPSEIPAELTIAAYPEREDPRDAYVSHKGTLAQLPEGAVVGTSSLRRKAQLLHIRPDLRITDLRGNLDTRLRKLDEDHYDAIILACAGLNRLGLSDRITEVLDPETMLPAAGQGVLGVECRLDDEVTEILGALDDPKVRSCISSERSLLASLNAGCQTPVAVLASLLDADKIELQALVASLDGRDCIRTKVIGEFDQALEIGRLAAQELIDLGAGKLLDEARENSNRNDMGAA